MGTSEGARKQWTPERRERQRQRMLDKWSNPKYKKDVSESIAESWEDAEKRRSEIAAQMSYLHKGVPHSEEHKAAIKQGMAESPNQSGWPAQRRNRKAGDA